MLWSFIAVVLSGWLYVEACYRGPVWQRWLFKPLTLVLLLVLAWQAPVSHLSDYLVLAGLLATLLGAALTLLPHERLLYTSGAFFLSYLFYAIWFASQKLFSFFWPLPLVLVIIGVVVLALVWRQLAELRWPVCLLVVMALVMVWLAGEAYFSQRSARHFSLFAGAILLLAGNVASLIRRHFKPFRGDQAVAAACHFAGHFLIVRTLYL